MLCRYMEYFSRILQLVAHTNIDPCIPFSSGIIIRQHYLAIMMVKANGTKQNGRHISEKLSDPQYLYINGSATESSGSSTFQVTNPMTGEHIYDCSSAVVEDYEVAIQSAQKAYKTWSRMPPSARRLIFLKAADILDDYLTQVEGVTAAEILSAEVSATKSWIAVNIKASSGTLREAAGLVSHIKGEVVSADRPGTTIMVLREAVGVIFAISPWNAPVNLTARAIATPLICGNTVVLKPSEFTPKSQYLIVKALTEAGLPAGALSFVPTRPSDAAKVTEYAVKHPLVRRVNFTGSDGVGTIIAGWASSVLKQCVLELGGKAPVLVLGDANIDDAIEAVMFGALSNNGQICMSTERVIVNRNIAADFRQKLVERVERLKTGNQYDDSDVTISGLYTPASAKRVMGVIKNGIEDGAQLLTGDLKISGPNGTIIKPHILDKVTMSMQVSQQETFGPLICLYEVADDDEAVEVANASQFTLCASVFSKDVLRAMDIGKEIRSGSVHVNGPTVYIEATLPNGGTGGRSGYGRFGGMAGVDEFTERKILSLARPGIKCPF